MQGNALNTPDKVGARHWPKLARVLPYSAVLGDPLGLGNPMRRPSLISIALAFLSSTLSAQVTVGLLPGPVPGSVGFSQLDLIDSSRGLASKPARPITVSLWYPAVGSSGRGMRLETYVELHRRADSFGVLPFRGWVTRSGTDTSRVAAILASEVIARLVATPAAGRFPLILYAASFRAPAYESFALFEFLAGHGFVVAAIPSVGRDTTGMSMDTLGVRAQIGDFELAYRRALELPNVDPTRVGTIGFSLGAVPAASLALGNRAIQAVASIDGALNYTYALLGRSADSTSPLHAAYLQLTQRSVASMPLDNTFFMTHPRGSAYHLQWRGLDHYDFGSVTALLRAARPKDYRLPQRDVQLGGVNVNTTPADERIRMYQELVRTIYLFFDGHLKDSAESKRALEARFDEPDRAALFSIRVRK